MCEIINLASVKNARRVAAAEEAHASAIQRKVNVHGEAARPEPSYRPAYCDPANEVRGGKYEATRGLSLAEIAKRIRSDIKAAVASGLLPTGLKVSVRTRTYSGGGATSPPGSGRSEGFRTCATSTRSAPSPRWR